MEKPELRVLPDTATAEDVLDAIREALSMEPRAFASVPPFRHLQEIVSAVVTASIRAEMDVACDVDGRELRAALVACYVEALIVRGDDVEHCLSSPIDTSMARLTILETLRAVYRDP